MILLLMILPALEIATNTTAFAQAISSTTGATISGNPPSTDNFNLEDGYTIEPVIWNLTAPDSVTFDDQGNMYIAEAGYPFTGIPEVPKILKVDASGNISVIADQGFNAPLVDIAFYNGTLFAAHRHKVSTVDLANGTVKDIIMGLPTSGDHHVNQMAFHDGRLYVGTGSVTNAGVVSGGGFLNREWLGNEPNAHDVPAMNVTLAGQNYPMPNPLTAEQGDNVTTGAFLPLGIETKEGQVIEGDIKCTSCILSANLDGTDLQLVGWGFRNPSGLAFNNEGRLFAVVHGADEREARMIANDPDKFYEILLNETAWYGWPDFFGHAEPVTDPKFQSELSNQTLQFVMAEHPEVISPLALFEPAHTATIQLDFADESFGFAGEAFVSQMGTFFSTPPELGIVGQDIVRVNPDSGNISQFLMLEQPSTSFRPTDVLFQEEEEDGNIALYVVDWGNLELPPMTIPNSGIVWKITKTETTEAGEMIPGNNTQPGG
jgi:glucose/arabinose dehydrogenase